MGAEVVRRGAETLAQARARESAEQWGALLFSDLVAGGELTVAELRALRDVVGLLEERRLVTQGLSPVEARSIREIVEDVFAFEAAVREGSEG